MRAFEIQTFQAGKWKIDSIFDDRELAVFEAHRMDDSRRHAGIRVVEEVFDENTQKSTTKTIFRCSKVRASEAPAKQKAKPSGPAKKAAPRGGRPDRVRTAKKRRQEEKKSGVGTLVAVLVLAIVGGVGTIVALRFLEQSL